MKVKIFRISLGKRLRASSSIECLGVSPNWEDYPEASRRRICDAGEVFYPSALYEGLFLALGKRVFPSNYYPFLGNKIKQTNLFQFLGISHPRTRLYYGRNRRERICEDFEYPFIAKVPTGSSQGAGVHLVRNAGDLAAYLEECNPAYIQEYLALDRDLRVVLVAGKAVHAYWRIGSTGEFRNNVSRGGRISFEGIPQDALEFAQDVARRCRFGEVGLDVCRANGRYYVIEANMVFGFEGFKRKGLDYYRMLADAVEGGGEADARMLPSSAGEG